MTEFKKNEAGLFSQLCYQEELGVNGGNTTARADTDGDSFQESEGLQL